jgi:hypothetical protein
MDLQYYRQRETAERRSAEQARSPAAREAHLQLAQSYRSVIDAYERLEALRPTPPRVPG